ncbi:hypothetical protein P9990_26025 (plasmid) [Prescottella equi]|uniref:hypothetical protein n=1 Tax=Rhodococcus hoagii TaxID=43767 RepID=UPI002577116E|nr:hypothetical protein [Prescottella equi]WJJ14282.1 hypothetical protein P9990_26025 [Prescottella equi]
MSTTVMQTVEIERVEMSYRRVTVNVPSGLDLIRVDLGDALAALSDAVFTGIEREGIAVRVARSVSGWCAVESSQRTC